MPIGHETECDYCGLPVRVTSATDQAFCCFGCRIAAAVTSEQGEEGTARWQLTRLGLAIFFTMNVTVLTLVLWSWQVYDDQALQLQQADVLHDLLRYTSLLLSIFVTLLLGLPLLDNAVEQLQERRVTTDLLIVTGVVAALGYSAISVVTGGQHTYLEVACMVLVAVTLGRWLEAIGKLKTTNAVRALEKLLPETVRQITPTISVKPSTKIEETTVAIKDIKVGATIRVVPGERIPLDGIIVRGSAAIDEQIISGESTPAIKEAEDSVLAGTLNLDGDLVIRVTEPANGGALLRIVNAVTQAATAKCQWQTTVDYVTNWFVPGIAITAIAVFAIHTMLSGVGIGLMTALSVLLIACPCALGIAMPLAIWAAIGRASEAGVLVQSGDAFTKLTATKVICFDKTGTLTTGTPTVANFAIDDGTDLDEAQMIALALAASSNHIFSSAIRSYLTDDKAAVTVSQPLETESLPGRGVMGRFASTQSRCYLGSTELMTEVGLRPTESTNTAITKAKAGKQPMVCIGWDGEIRAVFAFKETFRPETARSLAEISQAGYHVVVLTGDYAGRAASLQQQLGVTVKAGLSPEQKLEAICELRQQFGPVTMVGDGVNDAPALAEADVGIAMGCGADVTRESADLCLLGNNLEQLLWSLAFAKLTTRTVHQNLFWAFSYNIVGIALAAASLLNPIFAAVAMVGSSLFVISNSLRLANSDLMECQPRLEHTPTRDCSLDANTPLAESTPLVS